MPQNSKVTLNVVHHFAAGPEQVFDSWLDPKTAGKWLFVTSGGQMVRVEIDARVGGRFIIVRRDKDDVEHVGDYLEIDRPRRLVFTFAVPKFSAEATRVTIEIVTAGQGCELTLTHEGVLQEWAQPTQMGWGMILDGLENHLAGS